jgi:5'-methylthioadenosine phosphorylase
MPEFGVIAGSGIHTIPGLEIIDSVKVSSPHGEPSDHYRIGALSGREIVFLPRHGSLHHIPPHRINYRANIWGFRELGVKRILSLGAAGGISREMKPGSLVLLDQIIDRTSGREATFYDEHEVVHIDFTEPFCPDLRKALLVSAAQSDIPVLGRGTYIAVNGPRLETAAEIKEFSLIGADVVGMTGMPEAALARELEICFAGVAVVTNIAAGIEEGRLTTTEVVDAMKASAEQIKALLTALFSLNPGAPLCSCGNSLKNAKM